jgi:murein DD-endopeptidase MepM/ murein hydrolase activator NlpD
MGIVAGALAILSGCAASPAPSPEQKAAPEPTQENRAEIWAFPIANGALPMERELLPNATREYRSGVHEGVDIYSKAGVDTPMCREPVLNARRGWIVRADRAWQPMQMSQYEAIIAGLKKGLNEELLDRLRGRQVWVRTEDGTVLRYCHLSEVAPDIQVGIKVEAGTRLGSVGNSGTADDARGTGRNCHLHFEIWPAPDGYLGKGSSPRGARALYAKLFNLK